MQRDREAGAGQPKLPTAEAARRRALRRPSFLVAVFMLLGGSVGLEFAASQASSASPAVVASVSGSAANCSVRLQFGVTSVTAKILSGCSGGDYYLTSWTAQSDSYPTSFPQIFYATTNQAPWTVPLPPCFWQVDFAKLSSPPPAPSANRQFIAGKLGGTTCPVTTTTTVPGGTTSTTLANGTTTTTTPGQTTTTTPGQTTTTTPGGTTTSTTATTEPKLPGSTTTTTSTTLAPGQGGFPQVPPTTGAPGVAAASAGPGSSPTGTLAFTGFVALAGIFLALTLIFSGASILRANRGSAQPNGT